MAPIRDNPSKRWCFTLNNYTQAELAKLKEDLTVECCEYALIGKEVGATGTPHLQGFVNLKKKLRLNGVRKLISNRGHFERAKGTDADNKEYCGKGGDIHLAIGTPSMSGRRTDLGEAVELLRASSGNLSALAEAHPETFIRYGRGLANWLDHSKVQKRRDYKTELHVFTGPPGCGKSREVYARACSIASQDDVFYKSRGEWWDGYVGQRVVVIDDFYGWLKYDELLRITDRYPLRVPIKGAFSQFLATHVFVTSNVEAWAWYTFDKFKPDALMRRVTSYNVWVDDMFKDLTTTPMYNPALPINF